MAYLHCDFFSQVLGQTTGMEVILPEMAGSTMAGNDVRGKFPVLYLLHGYSGDNSVWPRYTALELYACGLPFAIVMPRCNHGFYINGDSGYDYFTFITQELPEKAAHFFHISNKREDTFIGGLSMGGYGALRAALLCPDQYGAAISLSGLTDFENQFATGQILPHALRSVGNDMDAVREKQGDTIRLLKETIHANKKLPPFYISCGTEDFLFHDSILWRDLCMGANLDCTFVSSPGVHDWVYWNKAIEQALQWLYSVWSQK